MSTRKNFKVTVIPSAGDGGAYTEYVEAVNPVQARKILEARLPSDWKTGGYNQV
jgi:hypothetical protein